MNRPRLGAYGRTEHRTIYEIAEGKQGFKRTETIVVTPPNGRTFVSAIFKEFGDAEIRPKGLLFKEALNGNLGFQPPTFRLKTMIGNGRSSANPRREFRAAQSVAGSIFDQYG